MRWLVVSVMTMALSATASLAVAQPAGTQALRFGATVALDLWSDLGDLDPAFGGSFDDAGFGLDLNFHFGGWRVGPARIYLVVILASLATAAMSRAPPRARTCRPRSCA